MKKLFLILGLVLSLGFGIAGCQSDLTPPEINGYKDFLVHAGDALPDFKDGITANDNIDGDLTSSIVVDSSKVNPNVFGSYPITYSVSDAAGNKTSVVVNYIVTSGIVDTIAPVITGHKDLNCLVGAIVPGLMAGVKATDNVDGDLTSSIVIDTSKVNTNIAGVYPIMYSVTDSAGNSTTVTASLFVKNPEKNVSAPIIAGYKVIQYYIGDLEPDYLDGVFATDDVDGDLTSSIVVDSSNVNLTVPGFYVVVYSVEDSAGNIDMATTSVWVIPADNTPVDRVAPVISGVINTIYLVIGTNSANYDYLAGVSALDDVDGSVLVTVDSSNVNPAVVGKYFAYYYAVDSAGNKSGVIATVIVGMDPNERPSITVDPYGIHVGAGTTSINVGDYSTVSDGKDAAIDLVVTYTGNIDFGTEGIYPIIVTVTDTDGYFKSVPCNVYVDFTPATITNLMDFEVFVGATERPTYDAFFSAFPVYGLDIVDNYSPAAAIIGNIDDSNIDYDTPGTYPLYFITTDLAGNIGNQSVDVTVSAPTAPATGHPVLGYWIGQISGLNVIYYFGDDGLAKVFVDLDDGMYYVNGVLAYDAVNETTGSPEYTIWAYFKFFDGAGSFFAWHSVDLTLDFYAEDGSFMAELTPYDGIAFNDFNSLGLDFTTPISANTTLNLVAMTDWADYTWDFTNSVDANNSFLDLDTGELTVPTMAGTYNVLITVTVEYWGFDNNFDFAVIDTAVIDIVITIVIP